jgi:predicted O-methyltransferase YrrM
MQNFTLLQNVLKTKETYENFKNSNKKANIKTFRSENDNVLNDLLNIFKPLKIIEVGSWFGDSALIFADYLSKQEQSGYVICVDTWLGGVDHWVLRDMNNLDISKGMDKRLSYHVKDSLLIDNSQPNIFEEFLNNVSKSGLQDYILPLRQTSNNAAKILFYLNEDSDFIYIDASHEYDDCLADLNAYSKLLNKDGVMIVDDLQFLTVRQAVEDFVKNSLFEYYTFHPNKAILKYK